MNKIVLIKKLLTNQVVLGSFLFLFFIFWMFFLDNYSVLTRAAHNSELEELQERKQYYTEKIAQDKARLNELQTSKENLEKFAREQFHMKNANEDVYVVKVK